MAFCTGPASSGWCRSGTGPDRSRLCRPRRCRAASRITVRMQNTGALQALRDTVRNAKIDAGGCVSADVAVNTTLLSLPEKLVITPKLARQALPALKDVDDASAVALLLIYARDDADAFLQNVKGGDKQLIVEYCEQLPEEFDLPLTWSDEELELLQNSDLREKIDTIRANIQEEHQSLCDDLKGRDFPLQLLTLDRYLWAQGAIFSRSFELEPTFPLVLVPLVDSLPARPSHEPDEDVENAAADALPTAFVRATRVGLMQEPRVALVASRSMGRGEALTVSRDVESNAEFMLDFGVAFPNRPKLDRVELEFSVSPMDPFFDDKEDILQQESVEITSRFAVRLDDAEEAPDALLRFLRFVCLGATDAFLLEAVFRSEVWSFMEEPVSRSNEQLALSTLRATCEDMLEGYGSDESQGSDNKEEEDLPVVLARGEAAKWVLRGQRKVLKTLIRTCDRELDDLDGKEYYQERRLRDLDLLRPVDDSEYVDSSTGRTSRAFDDYY